MEKPLFLFVPGRWVGAGKIAFSSAKDIIRFYTSWTVTHEKNEIFCTQRVELQGIDEQINNSFRIYEIQDSGFSIDLLSAPSGVAKGKGLISTKTIAWEFHGLEGVEGFEVYELQDNDDYMVHAEYSIGGGMFSTCVDGRIWRKEQESSI